jgi:hypothetical protein
VYPGEEQEEDVRQGYEPSQVQPPQPHAPADEHNLDDPFTVGDGKDQSGTNQDEEAQPHWQHREYDTNGTESRESGPQIGSFNEERNAWNDGR